MKKSVERLSLRKRLALEVFRRMRENQKALHPLKQLFWECTQRCNIQPEGSASAEAALLGMHTTVQHPLQTLW